MTRIGVGWSTSFQRSGLDRLRYRRLRYAYRAPSFFVRGMLAVGSELEFLEFDEDLEDFDLDWVSTRTPDVDILYVSTHGMTTGGEFQLALNAADWSVLNGRFGVNGPRVVVFDACNLVDLRDPDWLRWWRRPELGPALRLVLGFSTPATVGEQSSIRGAAFARELQSMPVVDAWFASIQHGAYVGTDRPVAIALGDDDAQARWILDHAGIGALPGPRSAAVPGVAGRS